MSSKEHYTTLGLSASLHTQYDAQSIKRAYRRALLLHHPDKTSQTPPPRNPSSFNPQKTSVPTIDDISLAYQVLSDPRTRTAYDRQLLLQSRTAPRRKEDDAETFHSGLDTVDLDDLAYDEGDGVWTRECRCGQERGFVVTELELEREVESGEVCVGCRGCSLWLRVVFAVDGGQEGDGESQGEMRADG
ncbi:hypothetical protein EV356DRAFT_170730 [Viridothelium virens]|uniref:Diphthamide biosynthesis protein 4 n=1 Tax=Viridothelium virens TaxID=1048519 RepID=A0A6A6HNB4_VIRVR|nr:hypothetical protein EV356DRAFT_170730 [Viridothelium virens]